MLERVVALEHEGVALREAHGRFLAEEVTSAEPVPAFDNSAMDGFAVRAADTAGASADSPRSLRLAGESRAGRPAAGALSGGEAIAISTGAVLPDGADGVVRVEDTSSANGMVEIRAEVERGRDVRRAGEDIEAGAVVLRGGSRIGPAELGVLASVGYDEVRCHRRPRVRVLSTGDELLEPDEPLRPGAVRNSNSYSVPALAVEAGAEVVGVGSVGDDRDSSLEAIEQALDADLTVICGGVSVGEHDHVRPALSELGAEQVFWGVALKPGKPTWFGVGPGGGLVFGLPGNPVSAMVTFSLFARPAIAAMAGAPAGGERAEAILDEAVSKRPGRAHAVRCRLRLRDDGWHAQPTGAQGSHVLTSMLGADALVMLPTEGGDVAAGERVAIELLPTGRGGSR